jgi:hypothetical protein
MQSIGSKAMTREDILRMADEAYELAKKDLLNGDYLTTGFLAIRDIHFHRLAAAAEREACAKVCEAYIAEMIGKEMADAIRARGESK